MKTRHTFTLFLVIMVLMLMSYCTGYGDGRGSAPPQAPADTTTETVYDTIPYYYPVPKDSTVISYRTVRLPAAVTCGDTAGSEKDSAEVVMPMESRRYEDSTFTAWVSGYDPRLDSIYVYPRTIYTTVTRHDYKPPNRWGITLGAGYGYVPGRGMQPYLGLGISYTIIPLKWR